MSSLFTKNRILDASVACFNRSGLANVRLQQISDEAGMSLGNMTYHFRTKDDILRAVWAQITQEQHTLLDEFRVLPLFEDVERLLSSIFALQQRYCFFFLDTLEVMRAYPDIQTAHRLHMSWQTQQISLALVFNQSRGALAGAPLLDELRVEILAEQFCMLADTWMYRCLVKGVPTNRYEAFQQQMWSLLFPYFTSIGHQEFQQLMDLLETGHLQNHTT
ncbi:MAG TPA: TetR/AcrR family transcriptional regulator [Saprospiraceae bacterium]|nr:TetR/AcrR family transcriptional regulator [Saprospiraceae bacterium]